MSNQDKCQGYGSIPGCGTTATWKDGKPFDVLVAVGFDEVTRTVIWACTDCIFLSGLGEPKEVPVAARCYRWFWGEKCSKPRRSTTNHWKFCSDECCDIIRKEVEAREANSKHHPTKGHTAPMSQPITEQDVAAYLTKYIQSCDGIPDEMKQIFIGRLTNVVKYATLPVAFIKEADDTLSVVIGDEKWPLTWEGMIGDSPEDALEFDHAVSEVGLLQRSYYTRVRRDSEDAPCPIQITKEANRTFSVVIGGKSWPIGSYGTIGHTVQDGEDFQKALLQHGSVAHAGGPYVVRIPSTDEIWSDKVSTKEHQARLARLSREFEHAMKARGGVGKSVGQIAYEGFYEHQSAPLYEALPPEEQLKWELAGTRAFTWMSVVPEEIEKEIQIIAGRKRLQILSQTNWGKRYREEHQEEATLLNSLAGFPRAPETKN
jgi:hypothetical protein